MCKDTLKLFILKLNRFLANGVERILGKTLFSLFGKVNTHNLNFGFFSYAYLSVSAVSIKIVNINVRNI